jgi:hypothetical protein
MGYKLEIDDPAARQIRTLEAFLGSSQLAAWQIRAINTKCVELERDPIACATLCLAEYNYEYLCVSIDSNAAYYYVITDDTVILVDVSFFEHIGPRSSYPWRRFSLSDSALRAMKRRLEEEDPEPSPRGRARHLFICSEIGLPEQRALRLVAVPVWFHTHNATGDIQMENTIRNHSMINRTVNFGLYSVICGAIAQMDDRGTRADGSWQALYLNPLTATGRVSGLPFVNVELLLGEMSRWQYAVVAASNWVDCFNGRAGESMVAPPPAEDKALHKAADAEDLGYCNRRDISWSNSHDSGGARSFCGASGHVSTQAGDGATTTFSNWGKLMSHRKTGSNATSDEAVGTTNSEWEVDG